MPCLLFSYSLLTDFFSSHHTCFNQEVKTDDLEIDLVRKEFVVKSKFFLGQWRKYQKLNLLEKAILLKLNFFSPSGVSGFQQQGTRVGILKERAYLGLEKKEDNQQILVLVKKKKKISRFRLSSSPLSYLYSQSVASHCSPSKMGMYCSIVDIYHNHIS